MRNQKGGSDLIENYKNKVCGECSYFTGEECNGYSNEGMERYFDSTACDEFVETTS